MDVGRAGLQWRSSSTGCIDLGCAVVGEGVQRALAETCSNSRTQVKSIGLDVPGRVRPCGDV